MNPISEGPCHANYLIKIYKYLLPWQITLP